MSRSPVKLRRLLHCFRAAADVVPVVAAIVVVTQVSPPGVVSFGPGCAFMKLLMFAHPKEAKNKITKTETTKTSRQNLGIVLLLLRMYDTVVAVVFTLLIDAAI